MDRIACPVPAPAFILMKDWKLRILGELAMHAERRPIGGLFISLGLALAVAALWALPLYPQETKLPNAGEVKALQSKFRQERDQAVKSGATKRFLPILLDKAEDFGK